VDAAEPMFDPRGVWAARVVNAQMAESQIFQPQVITYTGLSVVRIDRSLRVSSTICSLVTTPFGSVTTTWSPAAIAATVVMRESASAEEFAVGMPFTLARTEILGWRTDDPDAALPIEAADPRVSDDDADGHPGVTVQVSGPVTGEMYVASRMVVSLDGTIATLDRIDGGSVTQQEQTVLGASDELLGLGDITSSPIPAMSTFAMIRVQEPIDCALLIQTSDVLFMDP
jgi:hypothetical protein